MWKCDAGKQQQLKNCKERHQQFKKGRGPHTINIEGCKKKIGSDSDACNRELRQENMKVSADGGRNCGRGKHKFYDLCHAGYEAQIFSERPCCIVKYATSFRNRACEFGI